MRWQRIAQAAIALFVIGFIGMLVTSLRRERAVPQQQVAPDRRVPEAPLETRGGGLQEVRDPSGKLQWAVKFRDHVALADGRSQLSGNVEATINRGDRSFVVHANEADLTPGGERTRSSRRCSAATSA